MNSRDEFVAIGWAGLLALFASGFMMAESLEAIAESGRPAGPILLTLIFALLARSDAKQFFGSGRWVRGSLTWRREGPPENTGIDQRHELKSHQAPHREEGTER